MTDASLKKLNFVPVYGTKGYNLATTAYSSAKGRLPAPVKDKLSSFEETVSEVTAPYIVKAQDKGSEILKIVDDQVDKAMQNAGQVYQNNSAYLQAQIEKQKEFHKHNLEAYKAAREQYLKKVEDSVHFLKQQGITGTARKAADEVSAAISEARKLPAVAAHKVHEAFDALLAFEPVKKILASTKPAVDAAYTRYMGVHDVVLASPQYKKAYELSQAALTRAQETFIYRKAKENLYPLVAKYADPALEQISASQYYQATVAHLAPKAI